jgi:antitoxin component YwqK of YwqJK toxin-antitoxin module
METIRIPFDKLDITDDHFTLLWKDKPFSGIGYDLTPDGKLWSEQAYVNGMRDGIERAWSLSGVLILEDYSSHGNLHRSKYEWFEDGKLKREAVFEFGIRIYGKEWDSDGKLTRVFQLKETDIEYNLLLKYRKDYKDWGEPTYVKRS